MVSVSCSVMHIWKFLQTQHTAVRTVNDRTHEMGISVIFQYFQHILSLSFTKCCRIAKKTYFKLFASGRLKMLKSNTVPQSSELSADQIQNSAGGYVYKVDDMTRLRRFLCLGVEGGTCYVGEKELGMENAKTIQSLNKGGNGAKVVDEITLFSVEGRAAKQNPTLFALAMCARQDDDKSVKEMAYKALPKICRIPTHLFIFVEYCEKLSGGTGWGRAHRHAISHWYLSHEDDAMRLAMHVTKYRSRNGWTHKDLLRLAHPKPKTDKTGIILRYIINGLDASKKYYIKDENEMKGDVSKLIQFLKATDDIKRISDEREVISMIRDFGLVREHIPTQNLNSKLVWNALLQKMPMTAMLRNLAKMTLVGLLANGSVSSKTVTERLTDANALKKARIHPFNVLTALQTYRKGRGEKGKLVWEPVEEVVVALEQAFYKSFKNVEPTGLRYLIALDVSGSMWCAPIIGNPSITPREGSAAMCMVTARTEKNHEIVGFCEKMCNLDINSNMSIEEINNYLDVQPMGGTDCAQPMIWAKEKKKQFDVFIAYTDNETWAGDVHPSEALREYRKASGIWNAKLIVCGMSATEFTIADPEDPGMLDMAGFDSAAPEIIRNFSLGLI